MTSRDSPVRALLLARTFRDSEVRMGEHRELRQALRHVGVRDLQAD
jgi:hypothetical protein